MEMYFPCAWAIIANQARRLAGAPARACYLSRLKVGRHRRLSILGGFKGASRAEGAYFVSQVTIGEQRRTCRGRVQLEDWNAIGLALGV